MATADPARPPVRAIAYLAVVRLLLNALQRFVFPFLPAIARGLAISLPRAGVLVAARSVAGVAAPLAVATGEHRGSRRIAVTGLSLLVVGVALAVSTNQFALALAGFAVIGFAKPTYDVGAQVYLADRTPYAVRARYLSVLELTWAGGLLLGAPLAGWLIAGYGWRAPFVAGAALAVVAVALAARFLEAGPPLRARTLERQPLDRRGRTLLAVVAVYSLATEVPFVVFGAWLEADFGLTLVALGGVSTLIGLAELAGEGATLAFTDRIGKRRAVAIGLGVSVVAYGLLPIAGGSLVSGVGLLGLALLGFELTIVSTIPLASEVQPATRARYLARLVVAISLGRAGGALAGPWLFGRYGFGGTAAAAAALDLLALAILLARVPEHPSPARTGRA